MKKLFLTIIAIIAIVSPIYSQSWEIVKDRCYYNYFYDEKDFVVVNVENEPTFDIIFKDVDNVVYDCDVVLVKFSMYDEFGNMFDDFAFAWYYDPFASCKIVKENDSGDLSFIWGCMRTIKGRVLVTWYNKYHEKVYTGVINFINN